jgi:GNAT superfamily N-acetyltransferase
MNIRRATLFDLNRLITLRMDYLKLEGGLTQDQEKTIGIQLRKYFVKHIQSDDFFAILAEDAGRVASAAFLVITERPAGPAFITGKSGTVLNVLTYPEYRKRGLSTQVLLTLIEEARNMGVSMIDLFATPEGVPLYKKLGFQESKFPSMRIFL